MRSRDRKAHALTTHALTTHARDRNEERLIRAAGVRLVGYGNPGGVRTVAYAGGDRGLRRIGPAAEADRRRPQGGLALALHLARGRGHDAGHRGLHEEIR